MKWLLSYEERPIKKYVLIEKICSEYVEFIKSIVMKYLLSYFIVGLTLLDVQQTSWRQIYNSAEY